MKLWVNQRTDEQGAQSGLDRFGTITKATLVVIGGYDSNDYDNTFVTQWTCKLDLTSHIQIQGRPSKETEPICEAFNAAPPKRARIQVVRQLPDIDRDLPLLTEFARREADRAGYFELPAKKKDRKKPQFRNRAVTARVDVDSAAGGGHDTQLDIGGKAGAVPFCCGSYEDLDGLGCYGQGFNCLMWWLGSSLEQGCNWAKRPCYANALCPFCPLSVPFLVVWGFGGFVFAPVGLCCECCVEAHCAKQFTLAVTHDSSSQLEGELRPDLERMVSEACLAFKNGEPAPVITQGPTLQPGIGGPAAPRGDGEMPPSYSSLAVQGPPPQPAVAPPATWPGSGVMRRVQARDPSSGATCSVLVPATAALPELLAAVCSQLGLEAEGVALELHGHRVRSATDLAEGDSLELVLVR